MLKPQPMIRQHQHTAHEEHRIRELDDGEASEVLHVDDMAAHAKGAEGPWEFVDHGEEELAGDDDVDHAGEDFLGGDGVFFDDFGEIVEPAGDGEGEEEEA